MNDTIKQKEQQKEKHKIIKTRFQLSEKDKNSIYFSALRQFVKQKTWRYKIYHYIYRTKQFSVILLSLIALGSLAVVLQTVEELKNDYDRIFKFVEWTITILFTIEYFARVISAPIMLRYVKSRLGVLDFFAIFPYYLEAFGWLNINFFMVIRLVRLFKLIKLFDKIEYSLYTHEVKVLLEAVRNSWRKISIFLVTVLVSVTILGSLMYVLEGKQNGFTSIPKGIYWAIVTITTVGYGDVTPKTFIGQMIASALMLTGFSIIVVFTSIVGAEIYTENTGGVKKVTKVEKSCLDCGLEEHEPDAKYCKQCGSRLWEL